MRSFAHHNGSINICWALLPQGELILDDFGASGDGELEVLPILHDFRHPLDILPLLDDVIGHPWREALKV